MLQGLIGEDKRDLFSRSPLPLIELEKSVGTLRTPGSYGCGIGRGECSGSPCRMLCSGKHGTMLPWAVGGALRAAWMVTDDKARDRAVASSSGW